MTANQQTAVIVARLEGKVDQLVEVLRRVEEQTAKTNGAVGKHDARLNTLEDKDLIRVSAEGVRAELAKVVKNERDQSRVSRFAFVAAASTAGGLTVAAATYLTR